MSGEDTSRERRPGYKVNSFMIFGITVVLLGIVFLLHNLNVLPARNLLFYWPVLLVAAGLAQLSQSVGSPGRVGGAILVFVGGFFLLRNLDLIEVRLRDYWPLALVLAGGIIIWQAASRSGPSRQNTSSANAVSGFAILSGFTQACNSGDFRGGELSAFLGGCELDLREASIQGEPAVLRVFCLMGGIEIRVPTAWSVTMEGAPILGGMEDATRLVRAPEAPLQRLIVRGCAVLGGVEVKN